MGASLIEGMIRNGRLFQFDFGKEYYYVVERWKKDVSEIY
jgi:hypothetical protein